MIEIYCGDGKGKTTASVGLAVRAAGHDIPVIFAQFLKDDSSGEIAVLRALPEVQVRHALAFFGFVKNMSEKQREETKACYKNLMKEIEQEIFRLDGAMAVVILDEVLHACNYDLLEEEYLCSFLMKCQKNFSGELEFVLTGRNPSGRLLELADYVSEIQKRKHPFDKGIGARKGIEL